MGRPWAFWRRFQYGFGLLLFIALVSGGTYYLTKDPATCFDGKQNGTENGVDCGGTCVKLCTPDAIPLSVEWESGFRISNGVYNAVAYVANRNRDVAAKDIWYTFTFYDANNQIVGQKEGRTYLPPDSVHPIFEGRIMLGNAVPTSMDFKINQVGSWEKTLPSGKQFVIESRELKSADFSPRLEATITNSALTDSRDVEAVATIFDASGNPLTSSRTVIPLFEGGATKEIVFTWPEPIAKTLTSCEVPSDVVLALDLSGSINDDGGTPPEPLASVLRAASDFASRLRSDDQVGVVTFATEARTPHTLTPDTQSIAAAIPTFSVRPEDERGSTNIGDAITAAATELSSARHNQNARKIAVLITDGKANAPESDTAETYALAQAEAAKEIGVNIFAIGLGQAVNGEFIRAIASDPEFGFLAANSGTLDGIYRTISTAICEEGAAVIEIIPKAAPSS